MSSRKGKFASPKSRDISPTRRPSSRRRKPPPKKKDENLSIVAAASKNTANSKDAKKKKKIPSTNETITFSITNRTVAKLRVVADGQYGRVTEVQVSKTAASAPALKPKDSNSVGSSNSRSLKGSIASSFKNRLKKSAKTNDQKGFSASTGTHISSTTNNGNSNNKNNNSKLVSQAVSGNYALKTIYCCDNDSLARTRAEIQALRELPSHPNLLPCLECEIRRPKLFRYNNAIHDTINNGKKHDFYFTNGSTSSLVVNGKSNVNEGEQNDSNADSNYDNDNDQDEIESTANKHATEQLTKEGYVGVGYILMPLFDTTLEQYMSRRGGDNKPPFVPSSPFALKTLINIDKVLHMMRGVVSGISAMHSMGYRHNDIQPSNILLQYGDLTTPKICDLGSVTPERSIVQNCKEADMWKHFYELYSHVGYRAPEIWELHRKQSCVIGPGVDMFGVGCLLYYASYGRSCFLTYIEGGTASTEQLSALRGITDSVKEDVNGGNGIRVSKAMRLPKAGKASFMPRFAVYAMLSMLHTNPIDRIDTHDMLEIFDNKVINDEVVARVENEFRCMKGFADWEISAKRRESNYAENASKDKESDDIRWIQANESAFNKRKQLMPEPVLPTTSSSQRSLTSSPVDLLDIGDFDGLQDGGSSDCKTAPESERDSAISTAVAVAALHLNITSEPNKFNSVIESTYMSGSEDDECGLLQNQETNTDSAATLFQEEIVADDDNNNRSDHDTSFNTNDNNEGISDDENDTNKNCTTIDCWLVQNNKEANTYDDDGAYDEYSYSWDGFVKEEISVCSSNTRGASGKISKYNQKRRTSLGNPHDAQKDMDSTHEAHHMDPVPEATTSQHSKIVSQHSTDVLLENYNLSIGCQPTSIAATNNINNTNTTVGTKIKPITIKTVASPESDAMPSLDRRKVLISRVPALQSSSRDLSHVSASRAAFRSPRNLLDIDSPATTDLISSDLPTATPFMNPSNIAAVPSYLISNGTAETSAPLDPFAIDDSCKNSTNDSKSKNIAVDSLISDNLMLQSQTPSSLSVFVENHGQLCDEKQASRFDAYFPFHAKNCEWNIDADANFMSNNIDKCYVDQTPFDSPQDGEAVATVAAFETLGIDVSSVLTMNTEFDDDDNTRSALVSAAICPPLSTTEDEKNSNDPPVIESVLSRSSDAGNVAAFEKEFLDGIYKANNNFSRNVTTPSTISTKSSTTPAPAKLGRSMNEQHKLDAALLRSSEAGNITTHEKGSIDDEFKIETISPRKVIPPIATKMKIISSAQDTRKQLDGSPRSWRSSSSAMEPLSSPSHMSTISSSRKSQAPSYRIVRKGSLRQRLPRHSSNFSTRLLRAKSDIIWKTVCITVTDTQHIFVRKTLSDTSKLYSKIDMNENELLKTSIEEARGCDSILVSGSQRSDSTRSAGHLFKVIYKPWGFAGTTVRKTESVLELLAETIEEAQQWLVCIEFEWNKCLSNKCLSGERGLSTSILEIENNALSSNEHRDESEVHSQVDSYNSLDDDLSILC